MKSEKQRLHLEKLARERIGKHHSEETKKAMSISHKGIFSGSKNPFWGGRKNGKTNPAWEENKVKRICIVCGSEFEVIPALVKRGHGKCCSDKCRFKNHGNYIKGEKHPFWKGGKNGWRGCDWKYIRDKILTRDNHSCQICGKTKRLHIHHKNPYRLSKDNSEANLVTLCMSCHRKEELKIWNGRKILLTR